MEVPPSSSKEGESDINNNSSNSNNNKIIQHNINSFRTKDDLRTNYIQLQYVFIIVIILHYYTQYHKNTNIIKLKYQK